MKNLVKAAALGIAALGISANASAGYVYLDDTVNQTHYISNGSHKEYTHYIDGWNVGTHIAQSFDLVISLWDDFTLFPFGDLQEEKVRIRVEGVNVGTSESVIANLFLPSFAVYGSTLAQALLQITDTGTLSVKITSVRGDFYLGNSYLNVKAWVPDGGGNVSVVEPGMLALILAGFGAAGLAFVRRRRPMPATAA